VSACPTGCGARVKPGQLLCWRCWAAVPKPLQDDVWQRWDAYRAALTAPRRPHVREALQRVREAQGRAVNAAREHNIRRDLGA